ncbi:hypothetical protein AB2713_25700 [Citrobacter werkmanii]|uniref:hypothetical protein n=1 Tax=Citrobacter werkmanii TaxID=67827 RepID=UPI00346489E7
MSQQYTNELTAEELAALDKPDEYTPEELAAMHPDARAVIAKNAEHIRQHPAKGIYRAVVAGGLTRRGGVVNDPGTPPEESMQVKLDNGEWATVVTEGATVSYPDGTTAKIMNSAGLSYAIDGKGIVVVGSQLDNGDDIISTPGKGPMFTEREGVPMPVDFLAAVKGA